MRVNEQRIYRFCAGALRWLLIGFLFLVGVVLLMMSFAMIATVEPVPVEMIKRSRLFGILWFFAAVAWLVSVCWFAFFLQRRRRPRMMLRISAKSGYLHVGATGRFSLAEAKRTFIEMLEAVAQNKVGKVLFDGRGLEGSPEFMERFYYGKFAAETVAQFAGRGVSPSTEFAYVLEVPMRDPDRFGENVARNRGMRVTTFDHLNEALGWLGVTPANNPDAGEGK